MRASIIVALGAACFAAGQGEAGPRAAGATYYVDSGQGDDGNAGTSEGAAFRTLARAATLALGPGDAVLLRRGRIWRERLEIFRSGTEAEPITYGAYGDGALPVLTGADPVDAWTPSGDDLWSAPLAADPEIVFFDGALGARRASEGELAAPGDWLWDGGASALVVFSVASPEGVEAGVRHNAVNAWEAHDVVVRDLEIRNAVDAITLGNTSRVTLEGLAVRDNAGWGAIDVSADAAGKGEANAVLGCEISGTSATLASAAEKNMGCGIFVWGQTFVRETRIEDNAIHDNGGHGIGLMETSDNTIARNAVHGCGWSGVGTAGLTTSGNVIERNDVWDNCRLMDDCFGINVFRSGDDNVVRYNLLHGQHDTLHDPDVPVNEGYPQKYGTGGIRFDGGDPTLGVGNDYILSTGNRAHYNVIRGEYNGVDIYNFCNVDLANNTITGSAANGVVVMTYNSSGVSVSGTRVRNNIVAAAGLHLLAYVDAVESEIDHNLYDPDGPAAFLLGQGASQVETDLAGFEDATGLDGHSLAGDPLFVADLDFHLQSGSPAVDHGQDAGLGEDLDGTPVPQGAAPDIGAYELEQPGDDAGADADAVADADAGGDAGADSDPDGGAAACGCSAAGRAGHRSLLGLLADAIL
jgi:parallel beta-helix repeat protein